MCQEPLSKRMNLSEKEPSAIGFQPGQELNAESVER
jgi:hypothetical protein